MDEVDDADLVVERVAALDLGKAGLEACVRVPHPQRPGRRMQELRGYATTTAQLLAMAAWLRHWHVQRVVMESTSTYCGVSPDRGRVGLSGGDGAGLAAPLRRAGRGGAVGVHGVAACGGPEHRAHNRATNKKR